MTTTSRFPKLACGIAFAASILTGINAQAQHRGQMHVPPPHPSVRPNQPPAAGLTDFGSGGNTQALGRSAPPTWVGSAAPSNPGAYFQPPQQGYNNPQIPQGYYQQPQQNYYQPPQQGYYQPPQGYYQPPQQGYD